MNTDNYDFLGDIFDKVNVQETLQEMAKEEEAEAAKPKATAKVGGTAKTEDVDDFFASLGIQQDKVVDKRKPWMKSHEFIRVKTVKELADLVDKCIEHGSCSLDIESFGLDTRIDWDGPVPTTKHKIVGFCISVDGSAGYYIPIRHQCLGGEGEESPNLPTFEAEREIRRLCLASQPIFPEGTPLFEEGSRAITPPRVVIDFWHAKFDQELLFPITGIEFWHQDSYHDAMLSLFVIHNEYRAGLKETSKKYLKDKDGNPYEMIELKELFVGKVLDFSKLHPDEPWVKEYGGSDGICTKLLANMLTPTAMTPKFKAAYVREKKVAQVVRLMERYRVKIQRDKIQDLRTEANAELELYTQKIQTEALKYGFENFNPGSTEQVSDLLFTEKGLNLPHKPPKTSEDSDQYKTDAKSLEKVVEDCDFTDEEAVDNILVWVLKYRQITRILGTYLVNMMNAMDDQDQLRFQFKQNGAATGRFSGPAGDVSQGYAGIPPQGIPARNDPKKPACARSMRKVFVARPGYTFFKCDYAGQELRIAANISKERVWIHEFLHGSGDLHTITAKAFFNKEVVTKEERSMGKCVHPDTLILKDGYLARIGDLPIAKEEDEFRDCVGNTYDGSCWRPLEASYNGGVKQMVHVISTKGVITCSTEHQFKLHNGDFVKAADLHAYTQLEPVTFPVLLDSLSFTEVDAEGNRIPPEALGSNLTALTYLGKLFSRAGYVIRHQLMLSLEDLIFAGQVTTLLRAVGLNFSVRYGKNRVRIRLSVGSSWELSTHISNPDVLSQLRPAQHKGFEDSSLQVIAIVPAGEQHCVDITVGESHVYIANGFLTHNTANFALLYGGAEASIMRATGCNKHEAKLRKAAFDKALPDLAKWIANQQRNVIKDLGVTTAFGRWIPIPDAASPIFSIKNSCARQAINYPVQGTGADILKIVLPILAKRLHQKKWLKNIRCEYTNDGITWIQEGDDSVRMIMTVHDEIVFEVRHDRIPQAVPLIKDIMELPSRVAKWDVQLVVEPTMGTSWDGKYDWALMSHGSPYKEGSPVKDDEYVKGDRVYQKVPDWLTDILKFENGEVVGYVREPDFDTPASTPKPALKPVVLPEKVVVSEPPKQPVVTYGILDVSEKTAVEVFRATCGILDKNHPSTRVLKLITLGGDTLIDPKYGVLIDPDQFESYLDSRNIVVRKAVS